MTDKIQKLDLGDAAEQIRALIQLAYVRSISEEQWDEMIQGELKKFTEPTVTYGGYRGETAEHHIAGFEKISQELLNVHVREQLSAKLADSDYLPGGATIQTLIHKWLANNAKHLVENWVESAINRVIGSVLEASTAGVGDAVEQAISSRMPNNPNRPDPNRPRYAMNGNYIG